MIVQILQRKKIKNLEGGIRIVVVLVARIVLIALMILVPIRLVPIRLVNINAKSIKEKKMVENQVPQIVVVILVQMKVKKNIKN